ncbi:MAG: DUF84 family protein [Candidatus Njordarchaeota archaeon]
MERIIAVGSKNPVKIEAAREVCKKIFSKRFKIVPVCVPNAPKQPKSDDEMIKGAIYRAKFAMKEINAEIGIGMEGGIVKNTFGVFVKGWVAVADNNTIGLASTVAVQLPDYIWDILSNNNSMELEDIMVRISGIPNIGNSIGAIGFIANNYYDRMRAFRDALFCAFGRIFKKDIYRKKLFF